MPTAILKAHYDGEHIVLDEPFALPANAPLLVTVVAPDSERAGWAAAVEALTQAGVLDGQPLRLLGRYQRPAVLDPHGRTVAEAIAEFTLAPIGELIG